MVKEAKKAELYRQELQSGMSCKEIAAKYGISNQAVYAVCGHVRKNCFQEYTPKGCVWPGLRKWLNENRVSRRELLNKMGLEYGSTNLANLNEKLRGRRDVRISFIRKMRKITGLTYEELFEEDEA